MVFLLEIFFYNCSIGLIKSLVAKPSSTLSVQPSDQENSSFGFLKKKQNIEKTQWRI